EEPDYTVEMAEGSFEVRQYAPMLVASTNVSGERQEAASKGFSPLAGFIFGDNKPKAKIEMTAPVVQEPEREGAKIEMTAPVVQAPSGDERWTVSFVMPKAFTSETLPEPTSDTVQVTTMPAERVAAVRFSGVARDKALAERTAALEKWMADNGLTPAGPPRYAYYDPPWRLPFLRRNEVIVPLAPASSEAG
ncbi:MAG: heme-binding protein, partial [Pseudomonadota bacterium]